MHEMVVNTLPLVMTFPPIRIRFADRLSDLVSHKHV